jgi:hypothetical protein
MITVAREQLRVGDAANIAMEPPTLERRGSSRGR